MPGSLWYGRPSTTTPTPSRSSRSSSSSTARAAARLEEFQKLGYPVFTQDSLPIDADILERLFGDEVRSGEILHPMAISDVWKNAYSVQA